MSRPGRPAAKIMSEARSRGFSALGTRTHVEAVEAGLYVVPTPIGNLSDITLRALATLAAADLILAEDTRLSSRLLQHFEISTPMTSYHDHNAALARPKILKRLLEGAAIALISDAGTPLIADPGYKLVVAAIAAGIRIHGLPGPSAFLTALSVGGLPTNRFFFEGFLPEKSAARRERLHDLARIPATLVMYEGPSRLAEALADLAAALGARPAAVARELTKYFEDIQRGTLVALAERYAGADPPKGEIVIVVGPPSRNAEISGDDLDKQILDALASLSVKDAAVAVAVRTGLPRREIYGRALLLAGGRN